MQLLLAIAQFGVVLIAATLLDAPPAPAHMPASPHVAKDWKESPASTTRILITYHRRTWLELPDPPYPAAVAIKLKLERVGYIVTLDPEQPHDALVVMEYKETPGRYYERLEQGTKITCSLRLHESGDLSVEPQLSYLLEAETSWPQPVSSLYWDAVQHLEENPYYYYFGELVQGRLAHERDPVDVFSVVLRQPPLSVSTAGESDPLSARIAANGEGRRRAIRELGLLKDSRALDVLWYLAEHSIRTERKAAVEAMGDLGDPSALARLTQFHSAQTDPELRATVEAAIARLGQRT